jgi:hypothetical protein
MTGLWVTKSAVFTRGTFHTKRPSLADRHKTLCRSAGGVWRRLIRMAVPACVAVLTMSTRPPKAYRNKPVGRRRKGARARRSLMSGSLVLRGSVEGGALWPLWMPKIACGAVLTLQF